VHVLQKRFNEFNDIYRALKGSHTEVASFKFPSKTLISTKDQSSIKESRRERFNEFVAVNVLFYLFLRAQHSGVHSILSPNYYFCIIVQLLMKLKPLPKEVKTWLENEGHKGASTFKNRSGAVTRAFKDRPLLFPAPDERGLIFDLMMRPTPFLKASPPRHSCLVIGFPCHRFLKISVTRFLLVFLPR